MIYGIHFSTVLFTYVEEATVNLFLVTCSFSRSFKTGVLKLDNISYIEKSITIKTWIHISISVETIAAFAALHRNNHKYDKKHPKSLTHTLERQILFPCTALASWLDFDRHWINLVPSDQYRTGVFTSIVHLTSLYGADQKKADG